MVDSLKAPGTAEAGFVGQYIAQFPIDAGPFGAQGQLKLGALSCRLSGTLAVRRALSHNTGGAATGLEPLAAETKNQKMRSISSP